MTVDLLAATFWPEGTLFGAFHPHELEGGPDDLERRPGRPETDADTAARAEGFWAAMARHLWRPSDLPALP